jgi:uncharacterized protein (DUF1800 family)
MPRIPEYQPTAQDPWDRRKAAHLLMRAGFGPLPSEIDAAVRDGFEVTVRKVLGDGEKEAADTAPYPAPSWANEVASESPLFQLTQQERMRRFIQMNLRNQETKGWWLRRMAFARQPLQEKMTLFWHGHFTIEAKKVVLSQWVLQYNEFLRANSLGDFRTLLRGISRDGAMLRYLDNNTNRREHPNENYARELMELFSMGVGNYTEDDVKAAARAFTGWTSAPFGPNPGFRIAPFQHDNDEKKFLGRTGNLNGDDVIDVILEQPVTARFMAQKLCRFFVAEDPDRDLVEGLAAVLRENNYQSRPALAALFRSRAFYAPQVIGSQIKSPVQLVVGAWRHLRAEIQDPRILQAPLRLMGQDILDPPNVKGWDGDRAWINTTTLAIRQNLHTFMLQGRSLGTPPGPGGNQFRRLKAGDPLPPALAPNVDLSYLLDATQTRTAEARVDHFLSYMVPQGVDAAARARLVAAHQDATGGDGAKIRAVLVGIMQLPQYQLC